VSATATNGSACPGGWKGKRFGHKFRWTETVGVICRRCGGRPADRTDLSAVEIAARKVAEKA